MWYPEPTVVAHQNTASIVIFKLVHTPLFPVHFVCSDMYLAAGEYLKAVEIMGENGWIEKYDHNFCMCTCITFIVCTHMCTCSCIIISMTPV